MAGQSKKNVAYCLITFFVCISLLTTQAFALSIEQVMSSRQSVRSYTNEDVTNQQLLDVLWAAYGYTGQQRNVPQIGVAHTLIIYTVNQTGSYRFVPETRSLVAHLLSVNKQAIRSYISSWPSDANEVLVIVWDETVMDNHYFACAEAGCLAQNVHLAAGSLDLGTCVIGSINDDGLRTVLQLSSTQTPLIIMPLGVPSDVVGVSSPKYEIMNGNLPQVQVSTTSFEDALQNIRYTQQLGSQSLSLQQGSQLLWAAYGYSDADHRTTPSAYGIYPLVVYVSNSTGVYKYLPETHSVSKIQNGDKRSAIANAFSGQGWAATAPAIFVVGYDSSYGNSDGGVLAHLFMEVNTGCVIQQIILEASTQNLKTNVLSEGTEQWNGAAAQTLRTALGVSALIIPLYAVPVGTSDADLDAPTIGVPSQNPSSDSVDQFQGVTVTVQVTDNGVGVKEVVLSYRSDAAQPWTNVTMTSNTADTYTGEIQGYENGKYLQYKIVAIDHNNNVAIEDNTGQYYTYTVIPELENLLLVLMFFVSSTLCIFALRKTRKNRF
ncbi:MAG: nitroreductase family protein [Candidatus Bathyarchaeia archaeon]|jgi:deoxyinosine 3'endonuclease (endonuclease V)